MYTATNTAYASHSDIHTDDRMHCNLGALAQLITSQWNKIGIDELRKTYYTKHNIANLIQRKYGVDPRLVENYLSSIERNPLLLH
ncbi:MAG: hypothetical protein ACN2B6_10735 [Rickettsiales bacterium]